MTDYDAAVEALLREHRWTSGCVCACGHELNSPHGWALHLFAEWARTRFDDERRA